LTRFVLPQGYLPTNKERRERALERKRSEYLSLLPQYERARSKAPDLDEYEAALYHQVHFAVLFLLVLKFHTDGGW
jgi:hypothetical protein